MWTSIANFMRDQNHVVVHGTSAEIAGLPTGAFQCAQCFSIGQGIKSDAVTAAKKAQILTAVAADGNVHTFF